VTHAISKNHAMVCIEDLQIKNMSKSACGTVASPGRSVKAKSGLNKSILDQGWHEFRRQLEYKQSWRGGTVVAVSPHHTSQTCPECCHVDKCVFRPYWTTDSGTIGPLIPKLLNH